MAANVGLDAIPDACHGCTVEDRPKGAPDTERGAVDNGKPDMVDGADTGSDDDERSGDKVSNPDTKPALPPRQACYDHGRRDHPSVDIEGISHP